MNREDLLNLIITECTPDINDKIHSETGRKFIRTFPKEYNFLLEFTKFVTINSFNERFRVLKLNLKEYPKCSNPECSKFSLELSKPTCGDKKCSKRVKDISLKKTQEKNINLIKESKGSRISRLNLIKLIEKECSPNEELKIHNSKSFSFQLNYPNETKSLILYTNFVDNKKGISFNERYRVLKKGWKEYPICKADGCDNKVKISTQEYCGCRLGQEIQMKETSIKKYGVDNPSKSNIIKNKISKSNKEAYINCNVLEKRKKTNLIKYGTEHHMQNKEQIEKIKNILNEKYGGSGSKSLFIRTKVEQTNLKKYGFKVASQNKIIKEKTIQTNLIKYGKPFYIMSDDFKEKSVNTCLSNFGVDNIFKNSEYIQKSINSKYGVDNVSRLSWVQEKKEKTGFSKKQYIWKTGEISYVQGYEPFVLEYLENKGYKYRDVLTSKIDMPEIIYIGVDNKKHIYFPDIYIPTENLIIEVKSEWTMKKEFYKNMKKFSAVKKLGFNFQLKVVERDSKRNLILR